MRHAPRAGEIYGELRRMIFYNGVTIAIDIFLHINMRAAIVSSDALVLLIIAHKIRRALKETASREEINLPPLFLLLVLLLFL